MVTPFGDQCAPSRSPLLHSGSSTTSAKRAASPRTASAVSLEYSANSGQPRKPSVPMSSSRTNRSSLTGARYIECVLLSQMTSVSGPVSAGERRHDVGGGEFHEAAHAVI